MIICGWCTNATTTTMTTTVRRLGKRKKNFFPPQMFPVYTISFRLADFHLFLFIPFHSFPFIHFGHFILFALHLSYAHPFHFCWTFFVSHIMPFSVLCSILCASWNSGWRHIIETLRNKMRAITSLQMSVFTPSPKKKTRERILVFINTGNRIFGFAHFLCYLYRFTSH